MTRKMKDIPNQSQLVDIQNIHISGCDEIWDSDAMNEQNFSPSSKHMSFQSYEQCTIPERSPKSTSKSKDSISLRKATKTGNIKNKGRPELLKFNHSTIEE